VRDIQFQFVFAVACLAVSLVVPPSATAGDSGAFDKIALTSSGGLSGRGNHNTIFVDANGKITVNTPAGIKTYELKADELTQLHKLLAAVDWTQVKKTYRGRIKDSFQDDLAITTDKTTLETHVSEDADRRELPSALRNLLGYIKKLQQQYRDSVRAKTQANAAPIAAPREGRFADSFLTVSETRAASMYRQRQNVFPPWDRGR
jgi:hypothetical protein